MGKFRRGKGTVYRARSMRPTLVVGPLVGLLVGAVWVAGALTFRSAWQTVGAVALGVGFAVFMAWVSYVGLFVSEDRLTVVNNLRCHVFGFGEVSRLCLGSELSRHAGTQLRPAQAARLTEGNVFLVPRASPPVHVLALSVPGRANRPVDGEVPAWLAAINGSLARDLQAPPAR
jgi:hypothetical protein